MFEPNVTTIAEVARQQGCSRQAIYNAIARGDLNTVMIGRIQMIAKDEAYESYKVQATGGRLHRRYLNKQEREG